MTASHGDDFDRKTRPYRPELLAHSYRMLASLHDAEDAVQETYLHAWRGYDSFAGRASMRTWLYRIATNACLRALENRGRRALPRDLGGPGQDPAAHLAAWPELPWLEPIPDAMLGGSGADADDPFDTAVRRDSVRLAFVAALQHLPPRQRAVLVLREVLTFSAAEVAEMLDVTSAAVNSLLQRARAQLDHAQLGESHVAEPESPAQREHVDRYVTAMHKHDVDGLVAALTADAVWEMPPYPAWFAGARLIGQLVAAQCPGDRVLLPTAANGQPAFGLYVADAHGVHRALNLHVLTVAPTGISHVVAFFDLRLFFRFGLPETATPR